MSMRGYVSFIGCCRPDKQGRCWLPWAGSTALWSGPAGHRAAFQSDTLGGWAGLQHWSQAFLSTVSVILTITAWECALDCPFMALNNILFYYLNLTRLYCNLYVLFGLKKWCEEKYWCVELYLEFLIYIYILFRGCCNYIIHQLATALEVCLTYCWMWGPVH